jgi:hypothetical protein
VRERQRDREGERGGGGRENPHAFASFTRLPALISHIPPAAPFCSIPDPPAAVWCRRSYMEGLEKSNEEALADIRERLSDLSRETHRH